MTSVGGQYFDGLEDELVSWAAQYMLDLEKELTIQYPYGSQRLQPDEQALRFTEMAPQDYVKMIGMLNDKYRGFPDAYDRVNADLAAFLADMIAKTAGGG